MSYDAFVRASEYSMNGRPDGIFSGPSGRFDPAYDIEGTMEGDGDLQTKSGQLAELEACEQMEALYADALDAASQDPFAYHATSEAVVTRAIAGLAERRRPSVVA